VSSLPSDPSGAGALDQGAFEAMLLDALQASTVELFESYGVLLQLVDRGDNFPKEAFLGAVGLSAQGLTGSMILGAGSGPLRQSKPCATPDRDWVRELSNQLFGRVKMKLLRAGIEVWSTTPAVVDGQNLTPALDSARFRPLYFRSTDGEMVLAWAEVELSAKLQLDPPKDPEKLPTEGDVIIF
jgi:hypothetical protein